MNGFLKFSTEESRDDYFAALPNNLSQYCTASVLSPVIVVRDAPLMDIITLRMRAPVDCTWFEEISNKPF